MKFTVSRDTLVELLTNVVGAVEKRHTSKILENVLLSVYNGQLRVVGTDLEIELSAAINIQVDEEGAVTAPARKLLDITKALPAESFILIEHHAEDARLCIKGGRSRFELATLPAKDFPELDEIPLDTEIHIVESQFKRLLDKTSFCMANQDVRYYLNGLLLDIESGGISTVATDGHRLALCELNDDGIQVTDRSAIIVPRKGALELSRILESSSDVMLKVQLSHNHIRVEKDNVRFTSKLIDGKYPDYQAAVPSATTVSVQLDRVVFRDTLARVAILSNEKFRGIRLRLDAGVMTLMSNNPEQEMAEEEIDINYSGDVFEIGFNVSYVLDAVNHLEGEMIDFDFTSASASALLSSSDDTGVRYVVMPIRL
ncbi:MAG: DNA polymerase III subunit beta [Proteobacteria bacterium]|nr:MAG: DNA polymerase III subunit beta [Pseudomonadota bacterium]